MVHVISLQYYFLFMELVEKMLIKKKNVNLVVCSALHVESQLIRYQRYEVFWLRETGIVHYMSIEENSAISFTDEHQLSRMSK